MLKFLCDDLSVNFQRQLMLSCRIRNKLWAKYFGDSTLYYTDGWHVYDCRKEQWKVASVQLARLN